MASRKRSRNSEKISQPQGLPLSSSESTVIKLQHACASRQEVSGEVSEDSIQTASICSEAVPSNHMEEVQSAEEPKEKKLKSETTDTSDMRVVRNETTSPQETVHACMKQIAEEAHEIHTKWRETFRESEAFEAFSIVRVEALLKDAYALRESLESQKQSLVDRLKVITSILEKPLPQ